MCVCVCVGVCVCASVCETQSSRLLTPRPVVAKGHNPGESSSLPCNVRRIPGQSASCTSGKSSRVVMITRLNVTKRTVFSSQYSNRLCVCVRACVRACV